jgi:hypothetical protein
VSLLVYTLLIVYASWYPFSGWRDMGLKPFDYLGARLPYYWTVFDVWTNVAGYVPLGLLLVLALHPRLRPVGGMAGHPGRCAAVGLHGGGADLPAHARALQSRPADQFAGRGPGSLAAACSRTFLQESRLLMLRRRWFSGAPDAGWWWRGCGRWR